MSPGVKQIEILEVELPFKRAFKHALGTRRTSGSVFIKVRLEDGATGYGEALPREYVTGETVKSASGKLRSTLSGGVLGAEFFSLKKGAEFLGRLEGLEGASRCALELAVLDALGRHFNESVSTLIGRPVKKLLFSSAVIPADSVASVAKSAAAIRMLGFRFVKVKVGLEDDLDRLKVARKVLGTKIDIRVDANCAWGSEEAIERIRAMRKFGIKAIEQPVRADDVLALKKVADSVEETIIADESLTTVGDAEGLAKRRACDMFNIRLSKCGGILNALRIAEIARRNSIRCQLGCQVGESGVLAAAGRLFASAVDDIEYYEGSYGTYLLKEDVTRENMTIGFGGKTQVLTGPGLGINVVDKVLDRYTVNRAIIK